MRSQHDLTTGNIISGLWAFAVPLMLGNVLQQLCNLADTWVVGKCIGNNALAAVGASYTLMIFFDVRHHRIVSWQQCIYCYGIRKEKYRKDKERNLFVICIYGTHNRAVNCFVLRGAGYNYKMASGAAGNGFGHADLSVLRLYGIFCNIYI